MSINNQPLLQPLFIAKYKEIEPSDVFEDIAKGYSELATEIDGAADRALSLGRYVGEILADQIPYGDSDDSEIADISSRFAKVVSPPFSREEEIRFHEHAELSYVENSLMRYIANSRDTDQLQNGERA